MKKYSNDIEDMHPNPSSIVQGNYYDKYGSTNPIAKLLMSGFISSIRSIFDEISPLQVLDAGVGEGQMTAHYNEWLPGSSTLVAVDVSGSVLAQATARVSGIEPVQADIQALPFTDCGFDLVIALETLEHVFGPHVSMMELVRLSRKYVLVSVPREPVWRILNIARGAYWSEWGNTPGHIQHWSRRTFIEFISRYGKPVIIRNPFPWTVVLLDISDQSHEKQTDRNDTE